MSSSVDDWWAGIQCQCVTSLPSKVNHEAGPVPVAMQSAPLCSGHSFPRYMYIIWNNNQYNIILQRKETKQFGLQMSTIIWWYNNAYLFPAPLKPFLVLDQCALITWSMMAPILIFEVSSSQSSREPIFHKCLTLQNWCQWRWSQERSLLCTSHLTHAFHSTPAIIFPCIVAHKIRFNQDDLSFTSFEKGFEPAVRQWPWNLDKYPTISCTKQHIKKSTFLAIVSMTGVPGEKLLCLDVWILKNSWMKVGLQFWVDLCCLHLCTWWTAALPLPISQYNHWAGEKTVGLTLMFGISMVTAAQDNVRTYLASSLS